MFPSSRPGKKAEAKPVQIKIRPNSVLEERIITESLQKIADEFNATELQIMIKKLESFDNRLKLRAYLTLR
jgi:hypothetical protein